MRRAIWKGSISFGLVSIPVWLQNIDSNKSINFDMLDKKNNARIRYKKINAQTGKEVLSNNIVKGYKYNENQYVILNDEDFKKANVKATQTIDIENFVNIGDLDFIYFEKPYFLMPLKGAEKAYTLLKETLKATQKIGIAKIVIHTRQHLCAIIPHSSFLFLEILRFPHELVSLKNLDIPRSENRISPSEIKMAEGLVKTMTTPWNPKNYKDTYYNDMMQLIKYKIHHGKTKTVAVGNEIQTQNQSSINVIDLMPLLKKSLEKKKIRNSNGNKVRSPKLKKSTNTHDSRKI